MKNFEMKNFNRPSGCGIEFWSFNWQPRTQDLSLGKTLAAAGHVPRPIFSARGGVGKYQITSTCFQWEYYV
jgi:hypothetical protein